MRRRAERVWADFVEWCGARGLKALPAHPWTVAAFARWCEPRQSAQQIARNVRIIARAHLLACRPVPDRHPTVRRTLRAIELRQAVRRRSAALFAPEDFVSAGPPATTGRDADGKERTRRRRLLSSRPKLASRRPARR